MFRPLSGRKLRCIGRLHRAYNRDQSLFDPLPRGINPGLRRPHAVYLREMIASLFGVYEASPNVAMVDFINGAAVTGCRAGDRPNRVPVGDSRAG